VTTAEQWERLARDANAAAVKAMAEADRLRAELAALRAAGGQEVSDHKAGGCPDGGVCHHWCPDGGVCHHGCADGPCFRVGSCGPLPGVFPGDQWPAALRAAGGQEKPEPVSDPYKLLDDLIAETRKWRRAYDESQRISAAVVEGLRAELAERNDASGEQP
jgi:hypothetical protein